MTPDTKLYVVVAVLTVILAGIFMYLLVIDRKIGKIEKMLQEKPESLNHPS